MVVSGYAGDDYQNATIQLNDPYGLWLSHDDWCATCSDQSVWQDFTTFAADTKTDGFFVLVP